VSGFIDGIYNIDQMSMPKEPVWRLRVDQYRQMVHFGILTENDPVELLEGWIIEKMPRNPPHRAVSKLIRNALEQIVPPGWSVDTQEPIVLQDSELEPDITVIRGNSQDYLERHPGWEDVALVVEIADVSLERDRTVKKRIYARAGIPFYWIVNLIEQQIEVYTQPLSLGGEATYKHRQDYVAPMRVSLIIEEKKVGSLNILDLLP
jgi:Uma2 family endonuclease